MLKIVIYGERSSKNKNNCFGFYILLENYFKQLFLIWPALEILVLIDCTSAAVNSQTNLCNLNRICTSQAYTKSGSIKDSNQA